MNYRIVNEYTPKGMYFSDLKDYKIKFLWR